MVQILENCMNHDRIRLNVKFISHQALRNWNNDFQARTPCYQRRSGTLRRTGRK